MAEPSVSRNKNKAPSVSKKGGYETQPTPPEEQGIEELGKLVYEIRREMAEELGVEDVKEWEKFSKRQKAAYAFKGKNLLAKLQSLGYGKVEEAERAAIERVVEMMAGEYSLKCPHEAQGYCPEAIGCPVDSDGNFKTCAECWLEALKSELRREQGK